MKRREALQKTGFLLGGIFIGIPLLFESSCSPRSEDGREFLSQTQIDFLNEVAETILPKTDTPGAKEAKVGEFMAIIVRDCYTPEDSEIFMDGIDKINERCKQKYRKSFMDCNAEQRTTLLSNLDKEGIDYFKMMKSLTLTGYYTSEVGATQFLSYNPAPGRYDGCTSIRPW